MNRALIPLLLSLTPAAFAQEAPEPAPVLASGWSESHEAPGDLGSCRLNIPAVLVERMLVDLEQRAVAQAPFSEARRWLLIESGVGVSCPLEQREGAPRLVGEPAFEWTGFSDTSFKVTAPDGLVLYVCKPSIAEVSTEARETGASSRLRCQVDFGEGRVYELRLALELQIRSNPTRLLFEAQWRGPFRVVKPEEGAVVLTLSGPDVFDPAQPEGTLRLVVVNGSDAPVDVPERYDGRHVRLEGQGQAHRWDSWCHTTDRAEVALTALAPGEERVLLDVELFELFGLKKAPLAWRWDWRAHPKPPRSPIHQLGQEGYEASATLSASLRLGDARLASEPLRLTLER